MALLLYEPAFNAVTKRFPERFRKAILALTLVGGFASIGSQAGIANSMCVKLTGDRPAVNAFGNEVRAQTGKSISSGNAAVLLRLVGEM